MVDFVEPAGVARVEDEPAHARRNEPCVGLLELRLENHDWIMGAATFLLGLPRCQR